MPNSTATLMLAIWPIVTLFLFVHLPPGRALIATVLAAYLVLPPNPAAMDFPLLPPLNKETMPLVSALFVYLFVSARNPRDINAAEVMRSMFVGLIALPMTVTSQLQRIGSAISLPQSPVGKLIVVLFVFGPIATVLANPEPLIFQITAIRGLYFFDSIALTITQFLLLIGYLMARKFLTEASDQRDLLLAFVIGGLVYVLPILVELRLSPQVNIWVYGFFQHQFDQTIRASGYRPVVFLSHGIWVAFFVMTALVSSVALLKVRPYGKRMTFAFIALLFAALLVLCKTLGPLVFGVLLVPLVWFLSPRKQILLAVVLGVAAFSYPILKSTNLVPTNFLLERAAAIDPERAYSLQFRFENEDILFERAQQKPLFGWGSWGRNQIRNDVNGNIESVSDGRWIITIGVFGWVGFIGEFGLLLLPILAVWREVRFQSDAALSPYIGPLTLLLGANMIDLLPNATLTPLTWLLAGTLLGHAESLRRKRLSDKPQTLIDELPSNPVARPIL